MPGLAPCPDRLRGRGQMAGRFPQRPLQLRHRRHPERRPGPRHV